MHVLTVIASPRPKGGCIQDFPRSCLRPSVFRSGSSPDPRKEDVLNKEGTAPPSGFFRGVILPECIRKGLHILGSRRLIQHRQGASRQKTRKEKTDAQDQHQIKSVCPNHFPPTFHKSPLSSVLLRYCAFHWPETKTSLFIINGTAMEIPSGV